MVSNESFPNILPNTKKWQQGDWTTVVFALSAVLLVARNYGRSLPRSGGKHLSLNTSKVQHRGSIIAQSDILIIEIEISSQPCAFFIS